MSLANIICSKANSIGLNVGYNRITPADGNCFYHAVIEGLAHNGESYHGTYSTLRNEVVQFVRNNENSQFVRSWLAQNLSANLIAYINSQRFNGVFANELFIRGTAVYLNTTIVFTKETSTPTYQYDVFWPTNIVPENETLQNFEGPYILIGHGSNHFQSLLFCSGAPPESGSSQREVLISEFHNTGSMCLYKKNLSLIVFCLHR